MWKILDIFTIFKTTKKTEGNNAIICPHVCSPKLSVYYVAYNYLNICVIINQN